MPCNVREYNRLHKFDIAGLESYVNHLFPRLEISSKTYPSSSARA